MHPQPGTDPQDPLAETLGWQIGVGLVLIELAARLLFGEMAEQISFELQGQRTSAENPLLQADAQDRFRTHGPVEEERVTERGIDHLTAPGCDGPGLRMPVRNGRQ